MPNFDINQFAGYERDKAFRTLTGGSKITMKPMNQKIPLIAVLQIIVFK
jgi:hypothetical protein